MALRDAIRGGTLRADLAAVVSDRPDAKVLEFARAEGIPTATFPLEKGRDRTEWSRALADVVEAHAPDVVVLAGFMRILAPPFIDRFAGRILNVHPALLPAFPGHDGPAQAIRAGVRIAGCTVHVVDHGVDTGPILAQGAVPVLPGDDVASLHARIQTVEHRLFARAIDAFLHGEPGSVREDATLTSPSYG